jgi:hypothetical protein
VPPDLSPLRALQHILWGWHDTRRRTKQKYRGPQSDYSPDDIAAVAAEILTQAAQGNPVMVTKSDLFPSKYLKASDLNDQAKVLTIAKAPIETLSYNGKEERKLVLYFKGTPKMFPLNVTNFDGVMDATGEADTDKWPGKRIEVYPTTTQMRGEVVPCIRVREPAKAVKPAAAVEEDAPFDDPIPGFGA